MRVAVLCVQWMVYGVSGRHGAHAQFHVEKALCGAIALVMALTLEAILALAPRISQSLVMATFVVQVIKCINK